MTKREEFEEWAKAPPREWDCVRWVDGTQQRPWPDQYAAYHVQCAWEAWQDGRAPLLAEIEKLRDAAKRAEYWKAEHLAGNEEIERLRATISRHEDTIRRLSEPS